MLKRKFIQSYQNKDSINNIPKIISFNINIELQIKVSQNWSFGKDIL